ncbi:MAG: hypothetical protein ABIR32_13810 [Ilumatobacteraceae bacterium]
MTDPTIGETAPPTTAVDPANPWALELQNVDENGGRSLDSSLRLFAMAFGSMPGVDVPSGLPEIRSGTLAINSVLDRYGELTPEQQAVVDEAVAPGADDEVEIIPAAFAPRRSPLKDAIVDAVKDYRSTFAGKLGYDLPAPVTVIVASDKENFGYALAEWEGGSYSGCSLHISSDNGLAGPFVVLNTIAHELFHCFQAVAAGTLAVWETRGAWYIEGSAEWAAVTITTSDGHDVPFWFMYLTNEQELFARTYDGIGFFSHLAETGTDPWSVIAPMVRAGGNEPAWAASGADGEAFMSSWGSSRLRDSSRGAAWDTTGPGIIGSAFTPKQQAVGNGGSVSMGTMSTFNTSIHQLSISAEVTTVSATGFVHMNDGSIDVPVVTSTPYCTKPGGCGMCPDNTPLPDDPQPLGPVVMFGVASNATASSAIAVGQTVEDYCRDHQKVWVHVERPAMPGVLAGTVIELYGCTGPFGAWNGVLRTGGLDDGAGFTVEFAEIPVAFAYGAKDAAQTVHADARGNVPTPAGNFSVVFSLDFSVDAAGETMSISGTGNVADELVQVTDAFPGVASALAIEPAPAGTCG